LTWAAHPPCQRPRQKNQPGKVIGACLNRSAGSPSVKAPSRAVNTPEAPTSKHSGSNGDRQEITEDRFRAVAGHGSELDAYSILLDSLHEKAEGIRSGEQLHTWKRERLQPFLLAVSVRAKDVGELFRSEPLVTHRAKLKSA
jgi:hypothetical protein